MANFPDPSEWVDRYSDALYAFALFRTNDADWAEETVQETFLRGIQKLPTFEGKSSLKTWLMAILKNVVHETERQRNKEAVTKSLDPDQEEMQLGLADLMALPPDQAVERTEFWETVEHCLERMPLRTATIFRKKEIEGQSSSEVAVNLGVSQSNLWVSMHRARKFMRECLNHLVDTVRGRDHS